MPYRPKEDCRLCKGAGFVHPVVWERVCYEKIIPCSAPGCLRSSIVGGEPKAMREQTFETFKRVAGTEDALKAAQSLAAGGGGFVWLLLYGQPGNGKTHLCNATVRAVRDRGFEARLILSADLFATLREGMRDNTTDTILRRYKEVDFLAVDDYGVEYGSDWESAKFDELMTTRYANGLPTVLVTNKALADLPDRVRSRFQDKAMSRAVLNSAPDYRSQTPTRGLSSAKRQ